MAGGALTFIIFLVSGAPLPTAQSATPTLPVVWTALVSTDIAEPPSHPAPANAVHGRSAGRQLQNVTYDLATVVAPVLPAALPAARPTPFVMVDEDPHETIRLLPESLEMGRTYSRGIIGGTPMDASLVFSFTPGGDAEPRLGIAGGIIGALWNSMPHQ